MQKSHENFKKLREYHLTETKRKIKETYNRSTLLKELISLIDTIESVCNQFAEKLKHLTTDFYPKLSKADNKTFTKQILQEPQSEPMGANILKEDFEMIQNNASQLESLHSLEEENKEYLQKTAEQICPNLTELAGPLLTARLIATAGSLERLAKMPSTTIQLLGAEAALYRHLKTRAKPPKHGHIFIHPYVMQAQKKLKGKHSRTLAAKIAIAARVDYFGGKQIGKKLLQELK